jgi:hypothetical protein
MPAPGGPARVERKRTKCLCSGVLVKNIPTKPDAEPVSACVMPTRIKTDTPTKKGSISFLKKRNKKLLLFAPSRRLKWANQVLPLIGKSFLVLFFKKELLPSAFLPFSVSRSQRGLV